MRLIFVLRNGERVMSDVEGYTINKSRLDGSLTEVEWTKADDAVYHVAHVDLGQVIAVMVDYSVDDRRRVPMPTTDDIAVVDVKPKGRPIRDNPQA